MIRVTQYCSEESLGGSSESVPLETTSSGAYHYTMAGQAVVFDSKVSSLKAYESGAASEQFSDLLRHTHSFELLHSGNAKLQYSGRAPFDGGHPLVEFWRKNGFAQIDIDGLPLCSIDIAENHIHVLNKKSFDEQLNLELVTGPALVILLATQGVYCMHAGCIASAQGNAALLGESGAGKSTLSAHVDEHWRQVSDDILPVCFDPESSGVVLHPYFPQLKLTDARVVAPIEDTSKLNYFLRINPQETKQVTFKEVGRTDSMLQLIRHTVGAKLFDKEAMRTHAKFANKVSGVVPMVEVSYPRKLDQLDDLREQIIDYLGPAST